MHAYGLTQAWTHVRTAPGGDVSLRIVATPPTPGRLDLAASCDRLTAEVHGGDGWVEIAAVDGRFLSSEMCESFTGRVVGPYARSGVVDVLAWDYSGQDGQR